MITTKIPPTNSIMKGRCNSYKSARTLIRIVFYTEKLCALNWDIMI